MVSRQTIRFDASGGVSMGAHLAIPADHSEARPGLVVIHEIGGLDDDIRGICDRFAENGYVALAPDLFDRPGLRALCVVRTFRALSRGEGTAFDDLERAREYLAERPEVDGSRMGAVGFCMGGGFVLLLGLRAPYKVVAPYYGGAPERAEALEGVCPVVGGFGGRDRVFAPHGRRLKRHLETLGVDHDVKIYETAGHSFMSPGAPKNWLFGIGPMKVRYDRDAAEDSWARMLDFFSSTL